MKRQEERRKDNTNLVLHHVEWLIDEMITSILFKKMAKPTRLIKQKAHIKSEKGSRAFAYTDMKQKLRLTTLEVTATQETLGWERLRKCARI